MVIPKAMLVSVMTLGIAACSTVPGIGASRLRPFTDGVSHTSGEQGRWVRGCPPTPCNMGVGNLGPANTYHWVDG